VFFFFFLRLDKVLAIDFNKQIVQVRR